jgi:hypothetical protein
MNTFLLIITAVSLASAAALGILLARTMREERRRSAARVQLLSELAGRQSVPPVARQFNDFELRPAAGEIATVQDLFHEREQPSAWPRRFAVIAAMAAVLTISAVGYRLIGGSNATQVQRAEGAADTSASQAPPLELLTMRHASADGVLTITGQVRNPRSGGILKGVNATVLVFGPGGSFMTNMRTPLDYTVLAPGEESPFVIRVPLTGAVERYRIGFRTDDGRVLSHVDRRAPDTVARRQP